MFSQLFSLHAVLSVLHQKETLEAHELHYICCIGRFQHLLQSSLSLTIPPLLFVSNVYCGAVNEMSALRLDFILKQDFSIRQESIYSTLKIYIQVLGVKQKQVLINNRNNGI